jgi:myo-inositol-1-phosphate synthase
MTSGVLLVGVGGNNGSTFPGVAPRPTNTESPGESHSGEVLKPDWLGSTIMMGSTDSGDRLFERFQFANPLDIKVGGWDISGMNMSEAVRRAGVLNWHDRGTAPTSPSGNQSPWRGCLQQRIHRNEPGNKSGQCLPECEMPLREQLENIRRDIREFKAGVDNCIVLWTANTERMLKGVPESVSQEH